jgi:hypothetical protein
MNQHNTDEDQDAMNPWDWITSLLEAAAYTACAVVFAGVLTGMAYGWMAI